MQLNSNAQAVLKDRYYKGLDNSPEDVFQRVCDFVSQGESKYGEDPAYWSSKFFGELISPLKFLPNSPTIANAGTNAGCLSACFVISPKDTMVSILDTTTHWGMVEKWGGGVGASFDDIRPRGSSISTVHGKALGPVAVMRMLATNADEITQGAFRKGAHMGMLSISHPDIQDFIHCKDVENLDPQADPLEWMKSMQIQNFNISIKVTDEFMRAVEEDKDWVLVHTKSIGPTIVKARDLWDEICQSAWKTGDPGIAFVDRVRETEPNPHLGGIVSSNPCGEEWLENYGSCNLGSIDLGKFVRDGDVDWEELEKTVRLAVRFLNDVIEVNVFPLDEIAEVNKRTLRIGLGVMGWADMLIGLKIPYDSEEGVQKARVVGRFVQEKAWAASAELAESRGPYPEYENSALKKRREAQGLPPVRNSNVITIAPTGTLSLLAGCSGGIEPYFSIAWRRKSLWTDQEHASLVLLETATPLRAQLESMYSEAEVESILGRIADCTDNEDARKILRGCGIDPSPFRGAQEISPEWHIKMQAAWQEYVTNSVSKTINMPNEATVEDISEAYKLAWKLGCKCTTIYRDGSKHLQVLSTGSGHKAEEGFKKRPKKRKGTSLFQDVRTPEGLVHIEVRLDDDGNPFDVFTTIGKPGDTVHAFQEATSRMVSVFLRGANGDIADRVQEVVEQLRGITSGVAWDEGRMVTSTPDALALVLQENFLNQRLPKTEGAINDLGIELKALNPQSWSDVIQVLPLCPNCGSDSMTFQQGCSVCDDCGYSKCD